MRILTALGGALALGIMALGPAQAQDPAADYPNRPVRVIIPFAAGGGTDVLARLVVDKLNETLARRFVAENVGGAGGMIGAAQVAKAAPDGYTLVAGTPGPITYLQFLEPNLPFDPNKDFAPIALFADGPGVFVVGQNSPYKTVAELLAAAKKADKPMTFASSGFGAFSHLTGELFKARSGLPFIHVPYTGAGPAMLDVAEGRVDFMIEYFPAAQSLLQSGKVRALAVSTRERSPLRPELQTIAENGLPGFHNTAYVALMAPAKTPRPIIDKLSKATLKVIAEPEMQKRLATLGVQPSSFTPEQFGAYLQAEAKKIGDLIKSANIKATK